MKKQVKIAVSRTSINYVEREVDLPEVSKYYSKNDDGRMMPRGLMLFAIIVRELGSVPFERTNMSYTVVSVERGKQDYNDFIPTDDCKSEFWMTNHGVRKQAFSLMTKDIDSAGWEEITKEQFHAHRTKLLSVFEDDAIEEVKE